MALTQDQWYQKLCSWVPTWFFESGHFNTAQFQSYAKVFAESQAQLEAFRDETFITESDTNFTDAHGFERSVSRFDGESDASFSGRIQNSLFVPVGLPQLITNINNLLSAGACFIMENEIYGFLDDADTTGNPGAGLYFDDYYSRWLDSHKWYDWWTVVLPLQPSGTDLTTMFSSIVSVVENNKAFGTTYDILYQPIDILDESGDTLLDESGGVIESEDEQ